MMTEQAEAALKKQYKLLKKAIKLELKSSLKGDDNARNKLMELSVTDINALAKDIVAQAFDNNESTAEAKVIHKLTPKPSNMSFALKPLKESPCKQCPALNGGLCQCAIKQNNKKLISSVS